MQELSDLQESDPTAFSELTSQISDALQTAADKATASGDTNQASMLSDLADKFSTASTTGEMPDLTPPGPPPGGGPPPPPTSSTDSTSSSDSTSTSSSSSTSESDLLKQIVAAYTSGASDGTDPMGTLTGIMENIMSTVSSTTAA
jgi:hypothetical protein